MAKVLITYYSRTGNTEKIAEAIAEGVKAEGVDVEVKPVNKVDVSEIVAVDAVAIGSPISWGPGMCGYVKDLFERIFVQARDKVEEKPYVPFISCSVMENGLKALESIDSIAEYLKMQKVAEGVVCRGALGDKEIEDCRELGRKVAQVVNL